MGNGSLRKAVPGDADRLSACIEAAYAQYAERIDNLPSMTADSAGEIARHDVWVATVADSIVGALVLIPRDGFMLLANVAVHPDHQGAGLGRELLALADSEALAGGYGELRLNTHAAMTDNLRLYERLGWTQTGREGSKVSMRKTLAKRRKSPEA